MEKELMNRVDVLCNWAIEILEKMVSIPTVNPPGTNYREFVEFSSKVLESIGMEVKIVEVPRDVVAKHFPEYADYPRYILIARYGSGEPVIHFNGHYDVVPPGSGWSRDPFRPIVEDGKLYGRGAVDMKGGIVASILAVRAFIEVVKEFSGTLEIALVPDEEIGGATGTGYLVEKGLSKPNYVIIPEPSGDENLWIGHKGALWAYIEVYGKQAHGSTPWLGINAFEYMVKIANRFMSEYVENLKKRTSRYNYGLPQGAQPTITIGGEVKGGAKINIVPGYYAFSIDRRLIVEERLEDVEKELRDFIDKLRSEFPEVKIDLKIVGRLAPALTDTSSQLVQTTIRNIEKVLGRRPRPIVCIGGLDLHYYTEKGIQTISYGPGPEERAHMADEYVSLDQLFNVAKVFALTIGDLIS